LNQSDGSGQRWISIEDAGNGKELADRVRRGRASLRIVESPWGIEFYICETVADADGATPRFEILVPSTQRLSAATNAGTRGRYVQTGTAPATNSFGFGAGKSLFAAITMLCVACKLTAFLVASGLPPVYVELNRFDQPGSLPSLVMNAGFILIISFGLLALVRNVAQRTILQGLILGVLAADVVNDIALASTGNWLFAVGTALATAVSIPALVGILTSRRLESPHD